MAGLLTKRRGLGGERESKWMGKPLASNLGAQRSGRRRSGGRAVERRRVGCGGRSVPPLLDQATTSATGFLSRRSAIAVTTTPTTRAST